MKVKQKREAKQDATKTHTHIDCILYRQNVKIEKIETYFSKDMITIFVLKKSSFFLFFGVHIRKKSLLLITMCKLKYYPIFSL